MYICMYKKYLKVVYKHMYTLHTFTCRCMNVYHTNLNKQRISSDDSYPCPTFVFIFIRKKNIKKKT